MSLTILPCPFCGHDDVEIDEVGMGDYAVDCPECRAIVHDPRLAQITLQRLALCRAKAGEFCVIQEAA